VPGPIQGLSILITAGSNISYALMAGLLFIRRWLLVSGAKALSPQQLRGWGIASAVTLFACHLFRPWFVAASMTGSDRFGVILNAVPAVLSSTRQGTIWYANSLAMIVLLASMLLGQQAVLVAVCLCFLAATKAASGHAADSGDFTLAEISQFMHLLATAVWSGAILISGFITVPRMAGFLNPSAVWSYGKQLSKTVTAALSILFLSGIYVSYGELHGNVSALWTSIWGNILVIKLSVVAVALLLGSVNRFTLKHPATPDRVHILKKSLRTEAIAMLFILGISAMLAGTGH
jgi:putative copper resistance protein D